MTTVLLLEEHTVVRRSLRRFLDDEPGLRVCGGVPTVAEAIGGCWEPDVIVHELLFPDGSGPEVVLRLRSRFPNAGLLVLTRLETPIYVHLAMSAGADGYVLKTAEPRQVIDALVRVAGGEGYLQPSLGAMLARWEETPHRCGPDSSLTLTPREREVIELLALGHTNTEVAHALGIALRTVEAHRAHLVQKLGLRSRAELVRFVAEHNRCA